MNAWKVLALMTVTELLPEFATYALLLSGETVNRQRTVPTG